MIITIDDSVIHDLRSGNVYFRRNIVRVDYKKDSVNKSILSELVKGKDFIYLVSILPYYSSVDRLNYQYEFPEDYLSILPPSIHFTALEKVLSTCSYKTQFRDLCDTVFISGYALSEVRKFLNKLILH